MKQGAGEATYFRPKSYSFSLAGTLLVGSHASSQLTPWKDCRLWNDHVYDVC